MEFNQTVTAAVFAVVFLVIAGGTLTSPMPQPLSIGITVGLLVFGLVTLFVGVKHGEYRASSR
ncbi:DUF7333 family protein [Halomicrobium salinisoli]|uniref:DUF7333 family protein n=1 Tax=Halomicrobium salinisoli TaxID=2878391 RepID=UPI001CF01F94|nr:hypothetical protein [Halomicrobium salinisoli]